jgi:predicted glycoside hydrolase/deacetylase ChbG (UPF0249 family)
MGRPTKESKIKKLEELLAAPLTKRFVNKFWNILSKKYRTVAEMEEVYNWINKKASSVVKPNKIEELESCLEVADDLFSEYDCPPKYIQQKSEETSRYLRKRYNELTRISAKKLKVGPVGYECSETSC